MQGDKQIQITPIALCLSICRAHVNILYIIKVKILVLIKWSYTGPSNYVEYWA